MLQELSIRNLAIIDDIHIQFHEGLTILSGETGAGKSIIINAVNLLLGSRATSDLVRTEAECAEIEALFGIDPNGAVAQLLAHQGYDVSEALVIRRIISRNNRHRIYINGRMATAKLLTSITEHLANITSQHAHQSLLDEKQHLLILDQYGGLLPLRETVQKQIDEMLPMIRKLKELRQKQQRQNEHRDLLEFQKQEILDAAIGPAEDENLEAELSRLKHAEMLYQTVYDAVEQIYSGHNAIVERLVELGKRLDKAARVDSALITGAGQISEMAIHLEDMAGEFRDYLSGLEVDDHRLEAVEERLNLIGKLKRKYGGSLEAIAEHLASIETELSEIEGLSEAIETIEKQLSAAHRQLVGLCTDLSEKRKHAAEKMARDVEQQLATLSMGQTRFHIELDRTSASQNTDPYLTWEGHSITESGIDVARFMVAPNVGESLKPLSAIASGGELSRVVLAMKAIVAETEAVQTLIFDEVDAGIGGGVAEVVGHKLADLGRHHQVICITHLAQIASFGDHHFRIAKQVDNGRTVTHIALLDHEERVHEIARMIGGIQITPTTLAHARELLKPSKSKHQPATKTNSWQD